MYQQQAREEYLQALRMGQREYKLCVSGGLDPHPAVLDQILDGRENAGIQDLGLVEIPAEQIVGVKSAGRITAFSVGFQPLLGADTEFGTKWIDLCSSHLASGIREPIQCFEYLGKFYVQEGNKRVSVLRHFGAAQIPGMVRRVLPVRSEAPEIRAYYEFVDFYRDSHIYQIQFHRPGDYAALLSYLGKEPGEAWQERERRTFHAYYRYFLAALSDVIGKDTALPPEEALLAWLQVYPFHDLGQLSSGELRKTLTALRSELIVRAQPEPVEVRTAPTATDVKPGVLTRIISGKPEHLNVAFVHPMDPSLSAWVKGHEAGRRELEAVMGQKITVRSYFHGDSPQRTEALLEQAVAEGAEVVFTTAPQMRREALRMAVKYPKVRFLNCSVDTPFKSIRTYYGRIFEAKFITGAIAGAMAANDRIGYIGSAPTLGVPASINAFALGAQLTNPRAKILLRWSCLAGTPQADFLRDGIRVISNRDVPTKDRVYLNFCNYGTYAMDEGGKLKALASPVWLWGSFYEKVIRSIFSGTWDRDGDTPRAVNYWWGMDSGMIDVELSDRLPEGIVALTQILRSGLQSGKLDPFCRRILSQDGTLRSDGTHGFTPEELLHMDWLCVNVEGSIPEFEDVEPYAQPLVRQLGLHRDRIPVQKEGSL